jgi:hypothetical protein
MNDIMKKYLAVGLVLLSYYASAQSAEVIAKAAFMKAQEYYGNGQYEEAVAKLENVVENLGGTNPGVAYLSAQCYYA